MHLLGRNLAALELRGDAGEVLALVLGDSELERRRLAGAGRAGEGAGAVGRSTYNQRKREENKGKVRIE